MPLPMSRRPFVVRTDNESVWFAFFTIPIGNAYNAFGHHGHIVPHPLDVHAQGAKIGFHRPPMFVATLTLLIS